MKKIIASGFLGGIAAIALFSLMGPRDGAGNYTLPAGNPVVSGTPISSTWANNTLGDIASSITNSIAKDGQTVATANLPMGGFKHTNVANATATNQYAAAGQVQTNALNTLGSVAGTNTITGTLTPSLTAYTAGMQVVLTPANTITGATTLNINSVGALDVLKQDGQPLIGGDLVAGIPAQLVLDSGADDWILLNPQTDAGRLVVKAGDTSRASTTTLANDPELTMSLSAGTYIVESQLFWSSASASPLAKVNFATPTIVIASGEYVTSSGGGTLSTGELIIDGSSSANVMAIGPNARPSYASIHALVTISASGTFALSWAQSSSNATATVLKAGSYLLVRRIS